MTDVAKVSIPVGLQAGQARGEVAIDFGDGSDAAVLTALWSFAEDQGMVANCSAASILSAFEIGFNVQFDPTERRFRQKLLFALLDDLGCVFYDDYPIEKAEHLVGVPVTEVKHLSFPVQIAVLDALFKPYFQRLTSDRIIKIDGTHREKALRRTEVICDEVTLIRDTFFEQRETCTVSLVGVSRLQANILKNRGFDIVAWDRDPEYVGQVLCPDVIVGYADTVEEQLRGADVLLISGMTIGNNTLPEILRAASERGIPSACWAVTASSIAPLFRTIGLTSAICEGFPPYFLPGETHLKLFRNDAMRRLLATSASRDRDKGWSDGDSD
jgi:putative heavy-metal chelation protein